MHRNCNIMRIFAMRFIRSNPPFGEKSPSVLSRHALSRKDWPPARAGGFFVAGRHPTTTSTVIQR